METRGADKIPMANSIVVEDSETTVEIKIKTLDSQTYTLRVNKCVPVPALKEQIATVTGVLSDQQRLICRGRVLKDDQLLSAYHVEDGHTLHLVVRQPHQSSPPFIVSEGVSVNPANFTPGSLPTNPNQVSRTIVLETFNTPNIDSTSLNRLVANILNSFGASDNGSGNVSANIREANSERLPRPFSDTGASGTQNQQNITSQRINSDGQQEVFRFPSAASLGPQNLPEIPHSLTTLRQYLANLKNEFRREIPSSNANRDRCVIAEASTVLQNRRDNVCQSLHTSRRDDLPTPAALAEILQSTRQLLAEHAEECLIGLARELENDTSVTAYPMRLNVQHSAFRTGIFLQNLGSLLLELGRTTMTLRMGQGPTEAVVNSGPALFISSSGPNPVVVQPVPFYPAPNFGGMHFGSTNSGHGPEVERVASSVLPRNIDIRILTVPIPAAGQSGLGSAQLQQEILDSARTPADGESVHQAVQTQPHGATLAGEYGFGAVPVRTVVAMPAGINNSQSDLSGNLIPLLHPLLARIRQQNTGSVNNALRPQAFPFHQGTVETNQEPIPDSVRQILESYTEGSVREETQVPSYTVPVVSETGMPLTAQIERHGDHVYITSQRITPNGYSESSSHVNDGPDVSQGSLPRFLSMFNQSSSTILRGEQTGDVDQQVSAPVSCTEQASIDRDAVLNEASNSVNDQGVLFSNFLRHLMPLLPQGIAVSQDDSSVHPNPLNLETQRMNSCDPSSSQHQRDLPESPNSKRHKRE